MKFDFTLGTHTFSTDESINFQLNRWYNWAGKDSFEDLKKIGSKVTNYPEYIAEFLKLAELKEKERDIKNAAYYYRAAEFYMLVTDPRKEPIREKFLTLIKQAFEVDESQRFEVPYMNGFLPGYKFLIDNPKGTIVMFGGFDSYIEELMVHYRYFNEAGYNVIVFEGPGQGSALEDYTLTMDYAWEKPVKCILDYFNLDNIILIGLSLGGVLALQAAAYDDRIKHVIAFDVMYDFFTCNLRQVKPGVKKLINFLLFCKGKSIINFIIRRAMKSSFMLDWGINQGMHVLGVNDPYNYFLKSKTFNTEKISPLVKQDVLLLAGAEDHYVPLEMLNKQISALTNAKSVTGRIFTKHEHAENHCQIGNQKLVLDVIVNWMDFVIKKDNNNKTKGQS